MTDFGIAKTTEDAPSEDVPSRSMHDAFDDSRDSLDSMRAPVTRGDVVLGTPRYMAPEQHTRQPSDPRADQYAFCTTLWEALAQRPPFRRGKELLQRKLAGPPPWPSEVAVPRRISDAIRRGLAPKPEDRWPSMRELLDELGHDPAAGRRRWWFTGAAVILGAGVFFVARAPQEASSVCTGTEEHLAGVWDAPRRSELTARLLASDATYAQATAQRVGDALDEYAQRWVATGRDACEAHNVRGEQSGEVMDLRMACLQRASAALDAAVAVLLDPEASVVKDAHRVVRGLPRLQRCSDVAALRADVPPPEDPEVARAVAQARDQLARVRSQIHAGQYRPALDAATKLEADIAAIDYSPLQAETKTVLGQVLLLQARHDEAQAKLEEASAAALEGGDYRLATAATIDLAHLLSDRLAKYDEAERIGNFAVALARRPSGERMEEARAVGTLGAIAAREGDLERAEARLRESIAIKEQVLGEDHIDLADTLYNLGAVLSRRGHNADALPVVERALALNMKHLGPEHPKVASTVSGLGIIALESGDYDEADRRFARSIELYERAHGPDHPSVANQLQNWAIVHVQTNRFEDAEALHRRSLGIMKTTFGEEHPRVGVVLSNLAVALQEQGKREEALDHHRQALAIRERSGGPEVGDSLMNIGSLLHQGGEIDEALDYLQRSVAIYAETVDPDNPRQAWAMSSLGDVLWDLDRKGEALATYDRAIAIVGERVHEPELLAKLLFSAAQRNWEHGEDQQDARVRARALAERADGLLADVGEPLADQRDEVTRWLAEHPG